MKMKWFQNIFRDFTFATISDFSKKKSVHSINSLWFIFGLIYVVIIVNISSRVINYVPDLKDSVRKY